MFAVSELIQAFIWHQVFEDKQCLAENKISNYYFFFCPEFDKKKNSVNVTITSRAKTAPNS